MFCVQSSNFRENSENACFESFIITASYLTLMYEDIQQSIKKLIMIYRRKALIYFAEEIIMTVFVNRNFNFTSVIEEILM